MLHSAVIEVRQHLRCANVFLKFRQSLADFQTLKIFVDEAKVKVQNPQCSAEILVDKFFSILAGTFSNLIVDAENAAFRISVDDIHLSEMTDGSMRSRMKLNLAEKDETTVKCSNCSAWLASAQKYDKIREFPSGAIDVSEFFCHHGPNFKDVLVPSGTEMFYGFQFIVLNREKIAEGTREKENHLYCRRCLKYLGETILNGRAAKIWSDSVSFSSRGEDTAIFFCDKECQMHELLLKAIEETSLPSPEPLLRNMHFTKVLLRATFPNRQQQFLLVHILEKHLPVLRSIESSSVAVELEESSGTTCLQLRQNRAFKILYRLIANNAEGCSTEPASWPPILEYWQQDINILKMKISPDLFSGLYRELNKNINILPKMYRVNNDEFLMSYIFY